MSVSILVGNCIDVLATLPDASVHCCVTSPPYWGLRDYGVAPSVFGGDPACDHDWAQFVRNGLTGGLDNSLAYTSNQIVGQQQQQQQQCNKCAAWRGALGLEPTPQAYVENVVAVFREVRRVLRDDGTLWLNLGDSYASGGRGGGMDGERGAKQRSNEGALLGAKKAPLGLKDKDLVGIPWRVAFALQADGWYLRQDIIWSKPNPMPESVRDRCTKAHEYLFLLSKRERYYFDADAIAEPAGGWNGSAFDDGKNLQVHPNVGTNRSSVARGGFNGKTEAMPGRNAFRAVTETRNKRSVWTVATQPFSEAHFATFPPKLIEPCILAGCPEDGTVLDPFGGAGTTGLVADRHKRSAILIELNPEYAAMADKRIHNDAPLFADVTTA